MPGEIALRVQSADMGWQTLGVDRYRGVVPEGVKASANFWGPDVLGCTVKRRPGAIFPDLATWTPCELEVDGIVVWDGRLKEAPEQDGESFQIGVVGAGWQYHLDDDTNDKVWVHTRLGDWRDQRSFLTADLTAFPAGAQVTTDRGAIVMAWPGGAGAAPPKDWGVTLDLGPSSLARAKRIVVNFDSTGEANGWLRIAGGDVESQASFAENSDLALGAGGTGLVHRFTFTTARRYVHLTYHRNNSFAFGTDVYIRLKSVQVFGATAYESGDASILKTSDLVADVLSWAPLLSQDKSGITATTFSWPEFAPFDEKTAREIITAANAAERMQARVRVGRQLQYRAYPTVPLFEVGEPNASQFADASANSGDEIYNKAKVTGTGPDGARLTIVRTQVGTLADRAPGGSFTRTKVIPISAGLNTALGNKLGDAFLSVHQTTPFKGTLTAVGPSGLRHVEGGGVDPAVMLLHTGEVIRFLHRVDPDTGAWSRDGTIAQVDYDHDAQTATIAIDDSRDNFAALLERLGAVLGGN